MMKVGLFTSLFLHMIIVMLACLLSSRSQRDTGIVEPLPVFLTPVGEKLSVQKKKEDADALTKVEVEKLLPSTENLLSDEFSSVPFITKPDNKVQPTRKSQKRSQNIENIEDVIKTEKPLFAEKIKPKNRNIESAKHAEKVESVSTKSTNDDKSKNDFLQTLNTLIGGCVQRNWNLAAINGSTAYDLQVTVHLILDSSGMLMGEPQLIPSGGDKNQREIVIIQAREALKKCTPFPLPIEKYEEWHKIIINMKAFPA